MGRDKGLLEHDGDEVSGLRVAGDAGREEEVEAARPALGTLLTEAGLLTSDQVRDAVAEGAQTGERLGEVLLRHRRIGEVDLGRVIARQWQFPFVPDDDVKPDPTAAFLISPEEARGLGAIPFGFDAGQAIVAIADPTEDRLAAIHDLLGPSVSFVVVTQSAFERLIGIEDMNGNGSPMPPSAVVPVEPTPLQVVVEVDDGNELVSLVPDAVVARPAEWHTENSSGDLEGLVAELAQAGRTLATVEAALGHASGALQAAADRAAGAEHRLAESEQQLAAERTARELDQEKLVSLRAELEARNELFATVKAKLSELSGTLGTGQ